MAGRGRTAVPARAGRADSGATPTPRFAALHSRNFALLWVGSVIANSGGWMQQVALGWLVYDLTNSTFYLGLAGFARALPMLFLPPIGGAIADRTDRMRLLKVTQSIGLLFALIMALLVASGQIHVWHILVLAVCSGTLNAFDQPSRQALMPDLVPREHLTSAIALNSVSWQGAALFGPTLVGLVVAFTSLAGAFFVHTVSLLAVVVALYLMKDVPQHAPHARRRGFLDDLREGLRFAGATPLVLTLLLLAVVTNVFGRSYQQLLPAFAKDVLHADVAQLGWMMSAPGAGTIVGATLISMGGDIRHKGRLFFGAMFVFAAVLVAFSATRDLALALALLFVIGLSFIAFSTMLSTMLQLSSPGAMRGRVMSLVTVTMQGFTPLGGLLSGAVATRIGTPAAIGLSSALVLVGALVAVAWAPVVRDFGRDGGVVPE